MISAKYQPWFKRILVPFWVIQLGFILWIIISTSITLQYVGLTAAGADALVLSFCCACLLLDVVEIILFGAGKLRPLFYLISQVIKTTIWLILFLIAVVALATSRNRGTTVLLSVGISTVIFAIILLSFVATLIYASVIYRRARRGRADRAYASPPYQNTSPPYEHDTAPPFSSKPTPAHVVDNEIVHEHGTPAVFEMTGTSRSLPSHELESAYSPSEGRNGRKA